MQTVEILETVGRLLREDPRVRTSITGEQSATRVFKILEFAAGLDDRLKRITLSILSDQGDVLPRRR
jgi:hypothetical protein